MQPDISYRMTTHRGQSTVWACVLREVEDVARFLDSVENYYPRSDEPTQITLVDITIEAISPSTARHAELFGTEAHRVWQEKGLYDNYCLNLGSIWHREN